jgi:uncharacterized RDD family membrane protein YckC
MIYEKGWRRIGAALIDGVILGVAAQILARILLGNVEFEQSISFLGGWIYYAAMESSKYQGTLGKMTLGMIVTNEEGKKINFARASGRYFAKILSALILFIGFLMILFDKKGQGLHDKIAGCVVVRKLSK